jgi:hypothetical protein
MLEFGGPYRTLRLHIARQVANLREANLRGALLTGANLEGVDFTRAKMEEVDLTGADLRFANLRGANLRGALMHYIVLLGFNTKSRPADVAEIHHRGVNFSWADLADSEFANASMSHATFGDNDLSVVKGLDTVRHVGPSSISIDTIYRSQGKIPEVFLRGAGVPDDFIISVRSLVAMHVEFYSCFISYSSKDHDFASQLHADLRDREVRCWFAAKDLRIGDKFRTRIDESIRVHDKLIVILSESSIRSPWVEDEVETALEKERQQNKVVLFPIRLDDAVMRTREAWAASLRRTRHIGEFNNWKDHDSYQMALERLLRDLSAEKGQRRRGK